MTLKAQIQTLEATGLIQLAQDLPELEYLFRHIMVQDAAYGSLLLEDREQLHQAVAEILEGLYPQQTAELAAVLGHHFALAGQAAKAIGYYKQAGDAAIAVYANDEAVAHYGRSLELALAIDEASDQIKPVYDSYGYSLEQANLFDQALQNYEEMGQLASQRGDSRLRLAALLHQTRIRCTQNVMFDVAEGERLGDETLQLANALGDQAAATTVHWCLLNLYRFIGRMSEARQRGEQAISLARQLGLREQLAYALNDTSHVYHETVSLTLAKTTLEEATQIWRELNNRHMLADSLSTSSLVYMAMGEFETALALSNEAYEISTSTNNLWGLSYSRIYTGSIFWEWGQPNKALEWLNFAIETGEQAGFAGA